MVTAMCSRSYLYDNRQGPMVKNSLINPSTVRLSLMKIYETYYELIHVYMAVVENIVL